MKITGFCTTVITKDPEKAVKTFEALGFERRHNKMGDEDFEFSLISMKRASDSAKGGSFYVDVVSAPSNTLDRDLTCIRINVDDFEAACKVFESKGWKESDKFGKNETPSSKYKFFISPSGTVVDVCYHIKDRD